MTKANESGKSSEDGDLRYFLLAVRTGTDFIETATLSAAEIPLTVMASLGVSDETTDSARDSVKNVSQGIHGTVDSIAEQIASAVSNQVSLVTGAVSSFTKDSSDK